jgi:hypothetical protein
MGCTSETLPPYIRTIAGALLSAKRTSASLGRGGRKITRAPANSRMKDFYDLWMIAQTFAFEGAVLRDAVQRTFERHRTSWPEQTPAGLSDAFAGEKDTQWRAFLARDRLGAAPPTLIEVTEGLRAFLLPMLARKKLASWPPGGPWTYTEAAS